jgi:ADP-L-glycero-D-manno-heptose 6-epimerase
MIVVTGGEGFIGKNLISRLNTDGYISEDKSSLDFKYNESLEQNSSYQPENVVVSLDIKSMDLDMIFNFMMRNGRFIKTVFHLGAITDTTEMDRNKFDHFNVVSSMYIWNICSTYQIPLIYASSAATYGDGSLGFDDEDDIINLQPLNPYGWSKHQFDIWTEIQERKPPFWCGLKFFNVYGYGEADKGKMASVVFHSYNQIIETGGIKLFKSHNSDYNDGEQLRDFVYVDDIVDVCIWMLEHKPESGIYNVGTGKARTFNDLAKGVFNSLGKEEKISYINTPAKIRDKYQYFTEAKIKKLRNAGYLKPFTELEEGINKYINKLKRL